MLLKTDHDAIEKVRSDPRVRVVIKYYREFLLKYADKFERILKVAATLSPGKSYDFESVFLSTAIGVIGKVYKDVTGESPRTTDTITGKNPFYDFVKELFKREGLKAPTEYAIRQAIKKKNK